MRILLDVLSEVTSAAGSVSAESHALQPTGPVSRSRELDDIPPALAMRAIVTWSRLHGLVSLEIEGNFASMGIDPALPFDAEVAAIVM